MRWSASCGRIAFHAERLRSLQVDDELLVAEAFDGQIITVRNHVTMEFEELVDIMR